MKISAAIREYLIEIEVRKYTPKTIRGYRNSLSLFLRFCEQDEGPIMAYYTENCFLFAVNDKK